LFKDLIKQQDSQGLFPPPLGLPPAALSSLLGQECQGVMLHMSTLAKIYSELSEQFSYFLTKNSNEKEQPELPANSCCYHSDFPPSGFGFDKSYFVTYHYPDAEQQP
jgi:hypothetical protein